MGCFSMYASCAQPCIRRHAAGISSGWSRSAGYFTKLTLKLASDEAAFAVFARRWRNTRPSSRTLAVSSKCAGCLIFDTASIDDMRICLVRRHHAAIDQDARAILKVASV